MKKSIYRLNAFAKTPEGGNPAGVCLDTEELSEDQMQSIAAEAGFSETAFVFPSENADYKVRFFTPAGEVDLCGHATIATFSLMGQLGLVKKGSYKQETLAGILKIEISERYSIMMDQTLPEFGVEVDRDLIADSLNAPLSSLMADLPIQAVSTGLMDLIVPIESLDSLNAIEPDFKKITEISKRYNVSGYHLFTRETLHRSTAHCRNFAPLYDINEESATGTATGATTAYLFRYGMLEKSESVDLVFEQGYAMGRPSEIYSSLETKGKSIERVRVGGIASQWETMEITI